MDHQVTPRIFNLTAPISKGEVLGSCSYAVPPESLILLLRRANETLVERRFRDKSIVELSVTTKHEGNLVIIRPIERNLPETITSLMRKVICA